MQMLGVTVPIEKMVRVADIRWYGHVFQSNKDDILKKKHWILK